MNSPAAFQATYADFKLIKGRKCAQIILEVPIEAADAALESLGGVPQPHRETWVGVARIRLPVEDQCLKIADTTAVQNSFSKNVVGTGAENADPRQFPGEDERSNREAPTTLGGNASSAAITNQFGRSTSTTGSGSHFDAGMATLEVGKIKKENLISATSFAPTAIENCTIPSTASSPVSQASPVRQQLEASVALLDKPTKERRPWSALSYAEQAGIRCNEPDFWRFLNDGFFEIRPPVADAAGAAEAIRIFCDVKSRADIKPNTSAARIWEQLDGDYDEWLRRPTF